MGGIFWSQIFEWVVLGIGFSIGVLISIGASVLYGRAARDAMRANRGTTA